MRIFCPMSTLNEYHSWVSHCNAVILRTKFKCSCSGLGLQQSSELSLSQFEEASQCRVNKDPLQAAGVNTDTFILHATRSAASSRNFYQRYLWGHLSYLFVVSLTMVPISMFFMKWMLYKLTMVLINCLGFLPLAWGKTPLCILSIV